MLLRTALAAVLAVFMASAASAERLKVLATTGMIADAARVVGGDHVTVTALMGPGIDPHAYRPTRSDIAAALRADLVLHHGLNLEAQMTDFFDGLSSRIPVVAVGEGVPTAYRLADPEYPGQSDPHVWMAPLLWAHVVRTVEAAMAEAAPEHAEAFSAARTAYEADLEALETYAQEVVAAVPEPSRVLVTAHDAFGYFGSTFGFEVEGIQGISTESEAGLQRIGALVELLVSRKIPAVFVETSVSDRNIRALQEGASAEGHSVAIGGELFSDAMGPPGTYEGTYLGMMDHNFTVIGRALGADLPAAGRLGQLTGSD
ncbi:MAG: zinc ABC transporter substrate-binding protein [Pseudomonadota bacterium]